MSHASPRSRRSSWNLKPKSSRSSFDTAVRTPTRTLTLSSCSSYSDIAEHQPKLSLATISKTGRIDELACSEPLFHDAYISSDDDVSPTQVCNDTPSPEWSSEDDSQLKPQPRKPSVVSITDGPDEDQLTELSSALASVSVRRVSVVSVGRPRVVTISAPASRRGSEAPTTPLFERRASDMSKSEHSPLSSRRRASDMLPQLGKLPEWRRASDMHPLPTVPATPELEIDRPDMATFDSHASSSSCESNYSPGSPAWSTGSLASTSTGKTDSAASTPQQKSPASSFLSRPKSMYLATPPSAPLLSPMPNITSGDASRSRPKSLFWGSSTQSIPTMSTVEKRPPMVQSLSYNDTVPPPPPTPDSSPPRMLRRTSQARPNSLSKAFFNKLKSQKSQIFEGGDKRASSYGFPTSPMPSSPLGSPALLSPLPPGMHSGMSSPLILSSTSSALPSPAMESEPSYSPRLDAPSWASKDDFFRSLMGQPPTVPVTGPTLPRDANVKSNRRSVAPAWFRSS